jgi:hypothetical protein
VDEQPVEQVEGPTPSTWTTCWTGCGVLAGAAVVGLIAFLIADTATPCDCEGDPDRSFAESMSALPIGLGAAFLTLCVVVGVLAFKQSRENRP